MGFCIECQRCGELYDTKRHEECPKCKRVEGVTMEQGWPYVESVLNNRCDDFNLGFEQGLAAQVARVKELEERWEKFKKLVDGELLKKTMELEKP